MKLLALFAVTVLAFACGSPPKKETIVNDESSPNCCCKTIPATAEKEIVPVYTQSGRMECSSNHGDCVDDVQCNGQGSDTTPGGDQSGNTDGVPPPPPLEPSTSGIN
jgi:hypothetical protein